LDAAANARTHAPRRIVFLLIRVHGSPFLANTKARLEGWFQSSSQID
jgi:hypothetical protein